MGKTTLAKLIYNDDRVQGQFDLRIWVCVSDYFDLKKITEEMIESVTRQLETKEELRKNEKQIGIRENLTNLDSLQQLLKEQVASRRYLLVLDDVWNDKAGDWKSLYDPLKFGLEGSMILITTRISKVAEVASTLNPIELGGLPEGIYWELFKQCAFGSDDISSYLVLEDTGKRIAAKLKGSPLAAKTLGGILLANMSIKHWKNILHSELWQLEQDDDGILAALRVSYQYLPIHLRRCFLVCSLFPKDFPLSVDRLSPVWMADGIIPYTKNILSHKGEEYFKELESRSLILKGQRVFHDLTHDLSKALSLNMCYCQEEKQWSLENYNSVCHLSVYRKPFELIDGEISKCTKLRSLLFLDGFGYGSKFELSTLVSMFNQLIYLRLLDLEGCQIQKLPENIGNLKLLFYINLRYTNIRCLPESICQLYNLQVVNVDGCRLERFPKMFHCLINLRLITEMMEISSKIPGIGKLTSLEILPEFKVLKVDGHRIEELKNMSRLRGHLKISKLEKVEGMRDAAQACLKNKENLTELTLYWSPGNNSNFRNCESVIQGLEPHPNLEALNIENYGGRTLASWLQSEKLPCLRHVAIDGCSNLESLKDSHEPQHVLPLQSLVIEGCSNLVSLPLEWIRSSSIIELRVTNCPSLSCPSNLVLPSSLSFLKLHSCGELDRSLPSYLPNVRALNWLELHNCKHVTSLQSQVTNHLRTLRLSNCEALQYLELNNPSILEYLSIIKCPKLIQSDLVAPEPQLERIRQLNELEIDNTYLLKLPFLRNPPQSLDALVISDSPEERMFTEDLRGWLARLENLRELVFADCSNLKSLPEDLNTLVTLKRMQIMCCPNIQSLPKNGLPPSLNKLISMSNRRKGFALSNKSSLGDSLEIRKN